MESGCHSQKWTCKVDTPHVNFAQTRPSLSFSLKNDTTHGPHSSFFFKSQIVLSKVNAARSHAHIRGRFWQPPMVSISKKVRGYTTHAARRRWEVSKKYSVINLNIFESRMWQTSELPHSQSEFRGQTSSQRKKSTRTGTYKDVASFGRVESENLHPFRIQRPLDDLKGCNFGQELVSLLYASTKKCVLRVHARKRPIHFGSSVPLMT